MNERDIPKPEIASRAHDALMAVAKERGVSPQTIFKQTRIHAIAHHRQAVFFRAWASGLSLNQIKRAFGLDHTTIHHGIRSEANRMIDARNGAVFLRHNPNRSRVTATFNKMKGRNQ